MIKQDNFLRDWRSCDNEYEPSVGASDQIVPPGLDLETPHSSLPPSATRLFCALTQAVNWYYFLTMPTQVLFQLYS